MFDGPGNDPIELLGYIFSPLGHDEYVTDFPSRFPQEDAFALMGLDEGYRTVRPKNRHGNTGKTAARSHIRDTQRARRKVLPKEERLTVVALDDFLRILEAGQVQNLVPAGQQLVVPL